MNFIIRSIEYDEISEAETLIKIVFDEYVAKEYSADGIRYFYQIVRAESIRERFLHGNIIYVAEINDKIAGYIEIVNLNHIFLLFVAREFQNKGVAGKFVNLSLNFIKESNHDLKEITVNSTSNAVTVYEKLGFKKIADFQFKNGILSYPMSLKITRNNSENLEL